jgi:hypothetical protein
MHRVPCDSAIAHHHTGAVYAGGRCVPVAASARFDSAAGSVRFSSAVHAAALITIKEKLTKRISTRLDSVDIETSSGGDQLVRDTLIL